MLMVGLCALLSPLSVDPARAQTEPADGVPVKRVEVKGLESMSEGFVRRTVKTRESQPFSRNQVQEDVRELLRTRKFLDVRAETRSEDNQAVVIFLVAEKPTIKSVEIEGNKQFPTDELFKELTFAAGGVLDRFEINSGREKIITKYKEKGYYYVTVEVDEPAITNESRVLYRITEGPRVRIRNIRFEGVSALSRAAVALQAEDQEVFSDLQRRALDEEAADQDAAGLQQFYREEGYLDARVGYRLDFTDVERTRLDLVFVVEQGPRYRITDFHIRGNTVFDAERIRASSS